MKNIWMRAGTQLLMHDDEVASVLGSDREKATATIKKIISERRFCFDGESYIPQVCIEQFNAQYGTKYNDRDDVEFDIESRTFMKYKDLKKTDWYMGADVVDFYEAESGLEIDTSELLSDDAIDDCDVVEFHIRGGWLDVVLDIKGSDLNKRAITSDKIKSAKKCLIDNGVEPDEADNVLQALGYILLDKEFYQ